MANGDDDDVDDKHVDEMISIRDDLDLLSAEKTNHSQTVQWVEELDE